MDHERINYLTNNVFFFYWFNIWMDDRFAWKATLLVMTPFSVWPCTFRSEVGRASRAVVAQVTSPRLYKRIQQLPNHSYIYMHNISKLMTAVDHISAKGFSVSVSRENEIKSTTLFTLYSKRISSTPILLWRRIHALKYISVAIEQKKSVNTQK